MRALGPLAARARARRIEDACQAHGAERRRPARGAPGVAGAAFSFYPGKNLGRNGRRRRARAADPRRSRGRGRCASTARRRSTSTSYAGWTARLDTIQALVLLQKLPLLAGLERSAAARRRLLRRGTGRRRRPGAAARRTSGARRSGTSTWFAPPSPAGARRVPRASRGIGEGPALPGCRPPDHGLSPARPRRRCVPGGRGTRARVPVLAALPGHPRRRSWRPSSTRFARTSMADGPANEAPYRLLDSVTFGEDVLVGPFTNLYGCAIGSGTRIGPYVEIQRGATRSERGARSRATRSSATGSRSRTRCSSATAWSSSTTRRRVRRRGTARSRATATGSSSRRSWSAARSIGSGAVVMGGVGSARARWWEPGRS